MNHWWSIAVSGVTFCLAIAASATNNETIASDVLGFDAQRFCSQGVDLANSGKPPEVMSILDKDSGVADGYRIAPAIMASSAMDIAIVSGEPVACRHALAEGSAQFEKTLGQSAAALANKGGGKLSKDKDIADIQRSITQLWRNDQAARGAYVSLQTEDRTGSEYWARQLAAAHSKTVDETSKRYIESLLDRHDWIDRKRFGSEVSDQAWILVQHADDHPEFQALVLQRMESHLKSKGVSKENYAYLWDRVAVNTGRKQRYGTQPDWNCVDGKMALKPLEDPENVDRLRSRMGLNSVAKAMKRMNSSVCRS